MPANFTVPTVFTAIDKISAVVDRINRNISRFSDKTQGAFARVHRISGKIADKAFDLSKKSGLSAIAIAAPLGFLADKAIKFNDKLTDVAKTTGLAGKELDNFGDFILSASGKTRTGIDDLLQIAEIGGQLGVPTEQLSAFVDMANKFNVALGADYSGGVEEAISQVSKIQGLFKETSILSAAESINKVGSAINELGALGNGTSQNINDFILRIGALPAALKPSLQSTAGLGAYLEEMGIDSQVASSGFSNFITLAARSLPKFSKQMGMTLQESKALLKSDPSRFASAFARSLGKLSPDKLASKLNKLGIGSLEVIKVVGALGKDTGRLGYLQAVANKSFSDGTSLISEYGKKNGTTAAQIGIVKNNLESFAITVGTQLLPILTNMIKYITPIIKNVISWTKENKDLVTNILIASTAIAGFLGVISVASGIVGGVATVVKFFSWAKLLLAESSIGATVAMWAETAAMWALNVAMDANPIGLIIIAVAALIALITVIIKKWDDWGAALAIFMGPLGFVISLIQSLRRNWDMVTKAFKEGGILAGLKAIGKVFIDAILQPVEQLAGIIGKLTGWKWASNAALGIHDLRTSIMADGVVKTNRPTEVIPQPSTRQAQLQQQQQVSGRVDIHVKDSGNNVQRVNTKGPLEMPVKTTSTWATQ